MPLTDTAVRNAKSRKKPYRKFDGGGLYIEISPGGGKWWRFKYRFDGKEKRISLGTYPDVPLAGRKDKQTGEWINGARDKRDKARQLLADGIDPGKHRKIVREAKIAGAANSFEAVGREWFDKFKPTWADSHSIKIIQRLEKDVFPWIGKMPISEINAQGVLKVINRIDGRGAKDTAHRALQNCGQIFRYGVATGRVVSNPCRDLRGALSPLTHEHFASITEPAEVAELLRAIDGFRGTFVVQSALRLAPLLFARPGELRKAEWKDINLDKAEWRYNVSKIDDKPHIVTLAKQAVMILSELHALTGSRRYVFTGRDPNKSMSDAAINAALRRMGYDTKTEITGHGFRAMARTILHEELGFAPEVIEHQLSHSVPDSLGTAYNRTKFLKERRKMMQQWADYLDKLKAGAEIIPLHGNAA